MKRILVLLVALMGTTVAATAGAASPGLPSAQISSLSFVVERPAGPPVLLQFDVRAGNATEAEAAARRAVPGIIPGGIIHSPAPGEVTAQWSQWSWLWSDSEIPVPVAYNPTGAPPSVGPQAVISALDQWSKVPGSRFAYRWAGFTDHTASLATSGPDGENVISWQSLDCSAGCVLGVTTKETVHESDLVLNSNPVARMGDGTNSTADAASIILHETGHMAGLGHSCDAPFAPCTDAEANAVMYYQYRGIRRKLTADDMAGLVALYPASTTAPSPTGQPPTTATPAPSQTVTLSLNAGWNLTLLPAGDIAAAAAGLSCAEAVYSYDGVAWQSWLRAAAQPLQTLGAIQPGKAYWVYASQSCSHAFSDQ